jgi:aminoglycoside phosphotransferase (APT) family kinase protein
MDHPAESAPPREAHRFDERALGEYLASRLEGFRMPCQVRQFSGGQSNPTFHVAAGGRGWVLRKKPPGELLPSAHQVEREFRITKALAGQGVPVARVHLLCEDPAVIGTPFYVMDYVKGRVFRDLRLPGMSPADRSALYDAMNATLASIHKVDVAQAGLEDFGKPGNYFERQIGRWSKQYLASKTRQIPAMDALVQLLPTSIPPGDETAVVHGDFRMENLVFHPSEPHVLAVLDWELSTLGHPLADLAYNAMPYHMPARVKDGLARLDLAALGIPSEADYVDAYCRRTGRERIGNWNFYVAFSLFRMAAIAEGVYARGLQGNASSETALELGRHVALMAETARGLLGS